MVRFLNKTQINTQKEVVSKWHIMSRIISNKLIVRKLEVSIPISH